jgi:hypothetical protein
MKRNSQPFDLPPESRRLPKNRHFGIESFAIEKPKVENEAVFGPTHSKALDEIEDAIGQCPTESSTQETSD